MKKKKKKKLEIAFKEVQTCLKTHGMPLKYILGMSFSFVSVVIFEIPKVLLLFSEMFASLTFSYSITCFSSRCFLPQFTAGWGAFSDSNWKR